MYICYAYIRCIYIYCVNTVCICVCIFYAYSVYYIYIYHNYTGIYVNKMYTLHIKSKLYQIWFILPEIFCCCTLPPPPTSTPGKAGAGCIREPKKSFLENTTNSTWQSGDKTVTLQGMDTYPTLGEKENHLQNAMFGGYVNFLEGKNGATLW